MIEQFNRIKMLHSEIDGIISDLEKNIATNNATLGESLLENATLMNKAVFSQIVSDGQITEKDSLSKIADEMFHAANLNDDHIISGSLRSWARRMRELR
jgi:hypothetical protein